MSMVHNLFILTHVLLCSSLGFHFARPFGGKIKKQDACVWEILQSHV